MKRTPFWPYVVLNVTAGASAVAIGLRTGHTPATILWHLCLAFGFAVLIGTILGHLLTRPPRKRPGPPSDRPRLGSACRCEAVPGMARKGTAKKRGGD